VDDLKPGSYRLVMAGVDQRQESRRQTGTVDFDITE